MLSVWIDLELELQMLILETGYTYYNLSSDTNSFWVLLIHINVIPFDFSTLVVLLSFHLSE